MLGLKGPMADCPVEQECLEWAHKYLKDCVCGFRDEISLALGLISVFSWGVAEVPQIITNFREKNTEGVSLAFLMTWVLGDVFNLAGCYLEPATLPTQFYMALLYTVTTVILVGQTVYYDYLYLYFHPELKYEPDEEDAQKTSKSDEEAHASRPIKGAGVSPPQSGSPSLPSTINVPHSRRSSRGELYITSARSLASSFTPTVGSYLVGSRESGGQTQGFLRPSQGSGAIQEPQSHGSHPDSTSSNSAGGSLARTAAASILLVGTVGLGSNFLSGESSGLSQASGRVLLRTGRSLLLARSGRPGYFPTFPRTNYFGETAAEGLWGEVFGWIMAAIYMGGRLPQILLNIKRGTVEVSDTHYVNPSGLVLVMPNRSLDQFLLQLNFRTFILQQWVLNFFLGLNPLMFIFALVGNATYVASILVRTLEWGSIKPNMPWLVDAGVCVGLDCFIICQFVFYAFRANVVRTEEEEHTKGSYEAIR